MGMLSDGRYRLRALFRREAVESELNDELRFHFDNEVAKLQQRGLTPDEARRQARLVFGGHAQITEDCREARGTSLLESVFADVRHAARGLRKNPAFTAVAAFTLALGIGAGTAAFSLVDAVLLQPLPYPHARRAVMVWLESPPGSYYGNLDMPWAAQDFQMYAGMQKSFTALGAFRKKTFNLTGAGEPQLEEGVEVSGGFFPALGAPPLLGRTITAQDDQPGHDNVAVLSAWLWQTRYAGDRAIVGRTIDANGSPVTVIGVMPSSFAFPDGAGTPAGLDLPHRTAMWTPLALPLGARGSNDMGLVGELKPAVTPAQLNDDLAAFNRRFAEVYPQAKGFWTRAVPLPEQAVTETRRPLLLWMGAVLV
ncbi:MAG: ABC transporter permease, partial [Acidobacteriaceae bacterium]